MIIDAFAVCCTTLNITMSDGKAKEIYNQRSGIYTMYTGFVNTERFWVSSTLEYAIWYMSDDVNFWGSGKVAYLGTTYRNLYLPIQDPSLDCPYSLASNWKYWVDDSYVEDINSTISVECIDFDW